MKSEYQLFICDINGKHQPICVFVSDTPFPSFNIGERFDDHAWQRLDGQTMGSEQVPVRYTIHSIKHVIMVVDGKNIIQIGLNVAPYEGKRSPAFESEQMMTWSQAVEKSLDLK